MAMTGEQYKRLVAAYVATNFRDRGVEVFTETKVGKSIIGKDRTVDVFVVAGSDALAIECKSQNVEGTTDEKIPYALADLEAMRIPGVLVYAGDGFSDGIVQMLRAHPLAAYCEPDAATLTRDPKLTLELDVVLAQTFRWWDLLKVPERRFDVQVWEKARGAAQGSSGKKKNKV